MPYVAREVWTDTLPVMLRPFSLAAILNKYSFITGAFAVANIELFCALAPLHVKVTHSLTVQAATPHSALDVTVPAVCQRQGWKLHGRTGLQ